MKKNKLITSLSKAAMSAAMLVGLAGSMAPAATVFAAGNGLLDSGSSASSTSGKSSSSDNSSSSATDDSSSSATDDSSASSDSDTSSDDSSDTSSDDASNASADTPSDDSSTDTNSYGAKSNSPKSMPQTGLDSNVVKTATAAGIVGAGLVTMAGISYKKNHKNDYQMRK